MVAASLVCALLFAPPAADADKAPAQAIPAASATPDANAAAVPHHTMQVIPMERTRQEPRPQRQRRPQIPAAFGSQGQGGQRPVFGDPFSSSAARHRPNEPDPVHAQFNDTPVRRRANWGLGWGSLGWGLGYGGLGYGGLGYGGWGYGYGGWGRGYGYGGWGRGYGGGYGGAWVGAGLGLGVGIGVGLLL